MRHEDAAPFAVDPTFEIQTNTEGPTNISAQPRTKNESDVGEGCFVSQDLRGEKTHLSLEHVPKEGLPWLPQAETPDR